MNQHILKYKNDIWKSAELTQDLQKDYKVFYTPKKLRQITEIKTNIAMLKNVFKKIDAIICNLQLTINHYKKLLKAFINDVLKGKIKIIA